PSSDVRAARHSRRVVRPRRGLRDQSARGCGRQRDPVPAHPAGVLRARYELPRMTGPVRPGFLTIAERGIGDALTLLPSLRALRMVRPDLPIELLTPGLFPLADNLSDVATVLDHRPLQELGHDERLDWLHRRNPDAVWNTEGAQGRWTAALR